MGHFFQNIPFNGCPSGRIGGVPRFLKIPVILMQSRRPQAAKSARLPIRGVYGFEGPFLEVKKF
jgi:hypothetical protein